MDYIVTATGLLTVAAYVWSLRQHFASESMPAGARVISGAVTLTTIIYVALTLFLDQPLWPQVLGWVIQLLAGALFAATIKASRDAGLDYAFTEEKPRGLLEKGPYRYIRHPFYTSYIVFWVGWALATWSWLSLICLVVLIVLYVIAARSEEDKFAQTPMASAYAAYKQRAGLFWPKRLA